MRRLNVWGELQRFRREVEADEEFACHHCHDGWTLPSPLVDGRLPPDELERLTPRCPRCGATPAACGRPTMIVVVRPPEVLP
jgi:hypothetical protein